MKYTFIDRIEKIEVQDGKSSIHAIKNLALDEDYLRDHFPGNPVMPGNLMLESLVQAGAWLLRIRTGFSCSVILLNEAKNVKFGRFLRPGEKLSISVDSLDIGDGIAKLKGSGDCNGERVITARFSLKFYNIAAKDQSFKEIDRKIIDSYKQKLRMICNNDVMQDCEAAGK